MRMPLKLLFLDIDGVLNSHRTVYAHKGKMHLTGFKRPIGWPDDWQHNRDPKLDPMGVDLVRYVCDKYNYTVVLSSTWRIGWDSFDQLKECVQTSFETFYNWRNFPLGGTTPNIHARTSCRGDEIKKYLESLTLEVKDYIILDDDSDMLPSQKSHFFKVDRHNGVPFEFIQWVEERHTEEENAW